MPGPMFVNDAKQQEGEGQQDWNIAEQSGVAEESQGEAHTSGAPSESLMLLSLGFIWSAPRPWSIVIAGRGCLNSV